MQDKKTYPYSQKVSNALNIKDHDNSVTLTDIKEDLRIKRRQGKDQSFSETNAMDTRTYVHQVPNAHLDNFSENVIELRERKPKKNLLEHFL